MRTFTRLVPILVALAGVTLLASALQHLSAALAAGVPS